MADVLEVDETVEHETDDAERSRSRHAEIMRYDRYYPAEVEIVRGGTGREVTAYAAVFETPSEIRDQHGHYMEVIDRAAFNRTLSHGIERVGLYYNHGYHIDGTPSALGSVPLGSFLDIRTDSKGLLTRAKYNKTDLADAVLEAIRSGDIKGYSFRGRVFKSDPDRVPRIQRGGVLPTVYRRELGLGEAGPTPSPFYASANVVAIRSAVDLADYAVANFPAQERIVILRRIQETTDSTPEPDDLTEPETGEVNDVPDEGTNDATATPDEPESELDNEDVEVPEVDSPTPDESGLGTEGSPTEAPLPVSEAARSMTAADVARKARVALILRSAGEGG